MNIDEMLARGRAWYLALHDTEEWDSADGRLRLDEMDREHRLNLLRWLDERAEGIVALAYWGPPQFIAQMSETSADLLEPELEREAERMLDDPRGWLHDTPLYERLCELTPPSIRPPIPLPHEIEEARR